MSETSVGKDAVVTLREITLDTLTPVLRLAVLPDQEQFVASNAVSIAQAHFVPSAWFRAIYADDTPVGFLMLDEDLEQGEVELWRFMIDAAHQGNGYGRRALTLAIERVRELGGRALALSYVPGNDQAHGLYESAGFHETGEIKHGERVMRLTLTDGEPLTPDGPATRPSGRGTPPS